LTNPQMKFDTYRPYIML